MKVRLLAVLVVAWASCSVTGLPHLHPRAPRQTSFLANIINTLLRAAQTADGKIQTTVDLGVAAGYAVEDHTVVTADGYILTVHHIPPYANPARARSLNALAPALRTNAPTLPTSTPTLHARVNKSESVEGAAAPNVTAYVEHQEEAAAGAEGDTPPRQAPVVFLQHGLMGSSDNWNTNTEQHSLAYLLSDAGYDVWMGNFRGNVYSRRHVNMSHEEPRFWAFSYDEMALYDLPAMLEYVLTATGVERLLYVGHSMGTTVFFAMMSGQSERFQSRVAAMIALAPVATVTSISSPIKYLAPLMDELHFVLWFLGSNDQELMTNRLLISLWDPYRACRGQAICENLQFMITGFDPSRADKSMVPIILSHNPAGASTQTLFHFAQGYNSGAFQRFDWGAEENVRRYGKKTPPEYDVSNIRVPVTLFWADNDWMTGKKDIIRLEKNLPLLQATHRVANPEFSHLDFLWASDAHALVYRQILDTLHASTQKYLP